MWFVVRCSLLVVDGLMFVVCCLLFVVTCLLLVVCLVVGFGDMFLVRGSLCVVC